MMPKWYTYPQYKFGKFFFLSRIWAGVRYGESSVGLIILCGKAIYLSFGFSKHDSITKRRE
jgi:hypothetical protein